MLLLMFLVVLLPLNQILDEINLYNKTTETNSNKNRKVNTVFTKNKYGSKITKLFTENI